jgi:probable HAF family extracellular repeat protein
MRNLIAVAVVILYTVSMAAAQVAPQTIIIVPIFTLRYVPSGCDDLEIYPSGGISANGTVAGTFIFDGSPYSRACTWSATNGIKNLGVPSGYSISKPFDQNSNFIVGVADPETNWTKGWTYNKSTGKMQLLPNCISANGININNEVAGMHTDNCAAIWKPDGAIQKIVSPYDGVSWATDINDAGLVVGSAEVYANSHGFVYENNTMKILGSENAEYSEALAISNTNVIAGSVIDKDKSYNIACIWTKSGSQWEMKKIGSKLNFSQAVAINNKNMAVGAYVVTSGISTGQIHACVWKKEGKFWRLYDLNYCTTFKMSWVLDRAYGINDAGQIICTAWHPTLGKWKTILLNPKL